MKLSEFIGKKLTDIGTDEDTDTLFFEFAGGHQIHVRKSEVDRAIILVKAKESASELEERREEIKKARADARAAKISKATNTPAKKAAKKATKKSPTK